jgi:hypothetical protein
MLTKYGLLSVFRISDTPTFPLPDDDELESEEPQAARVAPRQMVTPTAAARVRRRRRPDIWVEERFMA